MPESAVYATHRLARIPGASSFALIPLAMALAGATAAFTIVNADLLRSFPRGVSNRVGPGMCRASTEPGYQPHHYPQCATASRGKSLTQPLVGCEHLVKPALRLHHLRSPGTRDCSCPVASGQIGVGG